METRKRRFFFFWLVVGVILGTAIPLLIFDGTRITLNNTVTTVVPTTTPNPNGCIIQPSPSIPPVCDPLYNLTFEDSPNILLNFAPLRFVYDTNFRRPIYIYQAFNDVEIVVVTPTWNYTIFVGENPFNTYLLLDCSSNVYVLFSFIDAATFLIQNTTLCKFDPNGALQYCRFIAPVFLIYTPILEEDSIYFISNPNNGQPNSIQKINIQNGNTTVFPLFVNAFAQILLKSGDRFYIRNLNKISAIDLNGTILNSTLKNYRNIFFLGYVSSDGYIYVIVGDTFPNSVIAKYDRDLTLIWEISLSPDNIDYLFQYGANRIFVNQNKLYWLGITNQTDPAPYLETYSDVDGSFIQRTYHPFAAHTGDYTLTFDSLSNSVYFLAIDDIFYNYSPSAPYNNAINTFCIS